MQYLASIKEMRKAKVFKLMTIRTSVRFFVKKELLKYYVVS